MMKTCDRCGRINPPDAAYCLTCATPLASGSSFWSRFDRGFSSGNVSSSRPTWRDRLPVAIEELVFDLLKAMIKFYLYMRDGRTSARSGSPRSNLGYRWSRFRQVVSEARTEYSRRFK